MPGLASRLVAAIALAATSVPGSACWAYLEAQERDECDQALEITRGCNTSGSPTDPQPATMDMLQRCDSDEVRAPGYYISSCIIQSKTYCVLARLLANRDESLCRVRCDDREAFCDLIDECHQFQWAHCDVPQTDAGAAE